MFTDRAEAGRRLAARLGHLRATDAVVVGLPRGGVPVASEVARQLGAPLDVVLVRKLGVPYQPELAMGAIGEGGVRVLSGEVLGAAGITPDELVAVERRERAELARRVARYRADRDPVSLAGRTVVVVDDGVATGATARSACEVVRARGAARVVLAAPVAPADWVQRLGDAADEYVCVHSPIALSSIGEHYEDFHQVTDAEVLGALDVPAPPVAGGAGGSELVREEDVEVQAGEAVVAGHLAVPQDARAVVLFAHGSGSSRHSPRNRFVAGVLNDAGLATLLFDLLTPTEERDRSKVFDIDLLGLRLGAATRWVRGVSTLQGLPVGYFGASTGAAAALTAAAQPDSGVAAVVSRGGRPDLAGEALEQVRVPTLLVVGGDDRAVLDLNRRALARLPGIAELVVVPGATHLFEEPGTLLGAAEAARDWFVRHAVARDPDASPATGAP